jgi:hypothetical protein
MRELFEVYLNTASDYLWDQFQRDLELSQRILAHIDNALEALGNALYPKK